MADHRAIVAVSEAVIQLLRLNYRPADFNNELEFRVYLPRDFSRPMTAGVSLFLYRILLNGTHRTPPGRIGPDGRRYQTQLPLDLHFFLTVWGSEASLQHAIAGWMMRLLEDTPILPDGLLNAVAPGVFEQNERVEIILDHLTNEDMFRIWETVGENIYQLSIPYVARNVRIESTQSLPEGPPVQERTFDYGKINPGVNASMEQ